jgi:NitT/TauT family transport system permease protein
MLRPQWLFSFISQGAQLAWYVLSPERILPPIISALLVIILWSIAIQVFLIPEFLLPSPKSIVDAMVDDRDYFLEHGLTTLLEASVGFSLAVVLGFILGTMFALFGLLERMLLPYAIASQAVPIVAVAPLFVLWLGTGLASKIAMAALICFFPMVVNTARGLRSVGDQYLALMHIYGATKWQIFWKLRFPASLAYLLSGMRISAALAMIGAIVAEYAGADRGLGYVIMQSTYRLDTVQLFAGIFYSAFGGLMIFLSVVFIEHVFFARYRG